MHHKIPQKLKSIKYGKTGSHKKIVDLICENPHIKSRGAYLLLRRKYRNLELKVKMSELDRWLDFRHGFLTKELKEKGKLKCSYCPRTDLVIGNRINFSDNNRIENLATIDHVIPLSKGGEMYNTDNMVVSCRCCNRAKGNTNPEDFKIINKSRIWKTNKEFSFSIEFINKDGDLDQMMHTLEAQGKAKAKRNTHRWFKKNDLGQLIKVY